MDWKEKTASRVHRGCRARGFFRERKKGSEGGISCERDAGSGVTYSMLARNVISLTVLTKLIGQFFYFTFAAFILLFNCKDSLDTSTVFIFSAIFYITVLY